MNERITIHPALTRGRRIFEYQIIGVQNGRLATIKSFWAADDHAARMTAGELDSGVVLVRMVERASPGRAGNL
jgi:hypothetical protein